MSISFDGKVAIVTGAGSGLGRAHALALASRGARVVVNDLGGSVSGETPDSGSSARVAAEIRDLGGEALANGASVTDPESVAQMVAEAVSLWGRIDILINNAGILRDRSFAKADLQDFQTVVQVHLQGAAICSKAVWPKMIEQGYGRILMTTSTSGIFGNFGQSNYGAAKAGLVGLMNVLAIEGRNKGIRVNALAPTAATRMTDGLIDPDASALLSPSSVSPAALFLVSDDAPTKTIVGAGAGVFTTIRSFESEGVFLAEHERTPETVAARWHEITDFNTRVEVESAFDQTERYVRMALAAAD